MSGRDFWRTHASPALGLPAFKMTDGPNGARGDLSSGATAACFPVGVAMGATFDPDLLHAIGVALAREAKTKKAQVLLGPTINLQRTPIGGRNFECYSEDPILTGALATAFVQGVQSEGVAACPKHFVANDTEYERHRVSSNVDARTLRELYLRPFEMVVRDAGPWMIMSSYNRINGVQANSNVFLLRTVLKGEWAFDGVVVSDWGGSTSTVGDYLGGLDLEMPGPARSFGDKLVHAIERGEAPTDLLDDVVARLKRLAQRTARAQTDDRKEESVDRPDDRALTRRAAIAGAVLLKNEGVLPLNAATLNSIAVIGPNAATGQIMGGGSSFVRAHAAVHPLEALRARLGRERVVYAQGCSIDRYAPAFAPHTLVAPDDLGAGFKLELFNTPGCEGAPTRVRLLPESQWVDFGTFAAIEQGGVMSARMRATYTPDVSGVHDFGLLSAGYADLFIDGVCVVENRNSWRKGEAFYTFGSTEQKGRMTLQAGRAYAVEIRFDRKPDSMMKAVRFGVSPPQAEDPVAEAVAAAKASDAVVLILGTNPDWETEGHDRADMRLPGLQDDLAAAVLAANPNAVVVLNVGAPVDMPWLHAARAVLAPWFPGQEFGAALADMLFGDAEPGGRLPFSWPAKLDDSPAYKHYVREGLEMPYAEGLAMGYRGHRAHGPAALFSFGHGLGYADIALDSAAAADGGVRAVLVNRSARAGGATVQIYAENHDDPRMRQLCAFQRVALQPGERLAVDIPIDPRRLAAWDEARNGWALAPGPHRLHVTLRHAEDEAAAPVALTV
ncbi:MAG: glycoside hydrolase family 3 C-terminal domain-containing protein [Hyphomonadaceae bacterium]|nr:glycoside hydrolase family 3 C-terminal domain-containing protein [Hyphomonadaceae bacterium]